MIGDSVPSVATVLYCGVPPGPPGQPTKVIGTLTSITIAWTAPTDNGGAPLTNYNVKIDSGNGNGFVSAGTTGNGNTLTWT